jgi:hypothetical protein
MTQPPTAAMSDIMNIMEPDTVHLHNDLEDSVMEKQVLLLSVGCNVVFG